MQARFGGYLMILSQFERSNSLRGKFASFSPQLLFSTQMVTMVSQKVIL